MDIQTSVLYLGIAALVALAILCAFARPSWAPKNLWKWMLASAALVAAFTFGRSRKHGNRDNGQSDLPLTGFTRVGTVAQDILLQRHEEAQDAIQAATTDPEAGPSLADLINADSLRRKRTPPPGGSAPPPAGSAPPPRKSAPPRSKK